MGDFDITVNHVAVNVMAQHLAAYNAHGVLDFGVAEQNPFAVELGFDFVNRQGGIFGLGSHKAQFNRSNHKFRGELFRFSIDALLQLVTP